MTRNVLILAAHPDDEVLGCGGAIARHIAHGDRVQVLFLTDGESSRDSAVSPEKIAHRRESATSAAQILGHSIISFLDFPDNGMDGVPLLEIIRGIERTVAGFLPDRVYCHFAHDLNVDHRIARQAALTVFRPQLQTRATEVFAFQVPSSTGWQGAVWPDFAPAIFVDTSPYSDLKRRAIECYSTEMRAFPHPRSFEAIEAADIALGARVGLNRAEGFMLERIIER